MRTDHEYIKLLIGSAQRGRKNSFIDLCEINVKKIYTMAVRILVDLDKAKEVTVNTSLAAWENIKFVRPDTPFDIWMKGIALFNIFTIIREQASKSESSSENLKPITPNTAIHSKNKLELLIMSLPDKERLIFILYSIEGYTYQEVSDFLPEFSVGEIKFVVRETRKKLIEALKDEL